MIKDELEALIKRIENHYQVKFTFDDNFLEYPYFKNEGKYGDLKF